MRHNHKFVSQGRWTRLPQSRTSLHITELPLGAWTHSYKLVLEGLLIGRAPVEPAEQKKSIKPPCVVKYKIGNRHDEQSIDLYVELDKDYSDDEITTLLKLSETKVCSESNMHVFDPYGHLVKFATPLDLLRTFCAYRIKFYELRHQYQMQVFEQDLVVLEERIRFIQEILGGTLPVLNQSKTRVCTLLRQHGYKPNPRQTPIAVPDLPVSAWVQASDPHVVKNALYSRDYSKVVIDAPQPTTDGTNEFEFDATEAPEDHTLLSDYKYLVSTSVFNMTKEEIQKLQTEQTRTQTQWNILKQTTPTQLWIHDLDELEKELVIHNKSNGL